MVFCRWLLIGPFIADGLVFLIVHSHLSHMNVTLSKYGMKMNGRKFVKSLHVLAYIRKKQKMKECKFILYLGEQENMQDPHSHLSCEFIHF